MEIAGQRVQVIKKDEEQGGVLEFGTELVFANDKSIAALLGASPGASTSVSAMLDVLNQCFVEEMQTLQWKEKLQKIIPFYHTDHDGSEWQRQRAKNNHTLHLDD